jgi:hypothetical protein
VLDGVWIELELGGELSRRGQGLAGLEDAYRHRAVEVIRDLPVERAGIVSAQLYEHAAQHSTLVD